MMDIVVDIMMEIVMSTDWVVFLMSEWIVRVSVMLTKHTLVMTEELMLSILGVLLLFLVLLWLVVVVLFSSWVLHHLSVGDLVGKWLINMRCVWVGVP